jgi:hypothetical protein
MIVTLTYIDQHKTENGAWTRKQIEALGLTWPPKKGWKKRVVGTELTEKQQAEFEKKQPRSGYTMKQQEAIKIVELMGYTLTKITKKEYKQ